MRKNVKNYLRLFLSVIIFGTFQTALGQTCGFQLDEAKAEKTLDGVPLYVNNSSFDKKIVQALEKRAEKAKEKYAKSRLSCPETLARVQKIMDRIFEKSGLDFLQEGADRLEIKVLCSKTKMPPVARIVAGKYLLIPASLPLKANSEDAMAAVIAHEVAHFTLRHHARLMQMSGSKGAAPRVPKSRFQAIKIAHENEADLAGLKLLANAGYNPEAAIEHLKNVQSLVERKVPNGSRTSSKRKPAFHQTADARVGLLRQQIKACGYRKG